ncbi:glycerate kinase [Flagellimonas aquimarina]|uniref:Glycerate kinase n=1 Tax=Flagellimonas aquimarina TaxID=2201895 RepID=A0A316L171_9FLAO|nr:glycerate kinase [Allomuricauda koreensis]PWL39581.1 glycerate kinase [Allomuricauda koreensis]
MKFVLAPDKYKGSLSGQQFCEAVDSGIKMVFPKAVIINKPLADGGDGTIEVAKHYLNASEVKVTVKDPLFRDIDAGYLLSNDKKTAFIEMSEASGYKLLAQNEMNCMRTTSFGTGQLIEDALNKGAKEIVLGIGGSATNDCGMGMATALGYKFLDGDGNKLKPTGENLIKVREIIKTGIHSKLSSAKFKVACDVNNPLYGKNGAAHVYGPQKGASNEEVEFLDNGLKSFANVIYSDFGIDVQNIPGAGAAGGLGAGALVFLKAILTSGVDLVMEIAKFNDALIDADWILTGEGQMDNQTLSGKTINGVLESAKSLNIPVAAFCGSINMSIDELQKLGLDYAVSIINHVGNLEDAKANSYTNLQKASFNFASLLKRGMAKKN